MVATTINIKMKYSTKGILLIILSALMFGSYGIWSRLMGQSFDIFYQGWTRALIISLLLLPILLYTKQIVKIKREDWKWLSIFLLFTSVTQAPLFYAYNHMDIGTATLLFFVSMLLTMYAVGFLFLGEKLTFIKGFSFVVASLGLYVTFSFSITVFAILAAFMAILNGIASGGEVSSSKKLTGSYSSLYVTWLSWVIIVITNGLLSVILGETQHLPSFNIAWAYQMGYIIACIIGFWAIIEGLKYTEASIGGLLGLLEIIFSISFGILIFDEGLTSRTIFGAVLIIFAAAFPHLCGLFKSKGNNMYKGKEAISK